MRPTVKFYKHMTLYHQQQLREYGGSRLAEELGVSRQAVSSWIKRRQIPPDRVRRVEALTGIKARYLSPHHYRE